MGSTWQKGVNTAETNSLKMLHTSLKLHVFESSARLWTKTKVPEILVIHSEILF